MSEHASSKEHPRLAQAHTARTPMEARIVASVLLDAGIPAYVNDSLMQDEFTITQTLMNLQQCTILVPEERVDEARAEIERARSSADHGGQGRLGDVHADPDEGPGGDG